MASIHKEILLEATPEQVWAAVRAVGAMRQRLAPGFVVDTCVEGNAGILTYASRGRSVSLLVTVDDEVRWLAYAHATTPRSRLLPRVRRSQLVWITDVMSNGLAGEIHAASRPDTLARSRCDLAC